ncbi:hypothetical protein MBLNU459_g6443t3 [Dothideomycetes sp. NU459]
MSWPRPGNGNLYPPSHLCIVKLQSDADAAKLISRSILCHAIYDLWGVGSDYSTLHSDIKARTSHLWPRYEHSSFNFQFDSYQGKRSNATKNSIINTFSYVGFKGSPVMKNPDLFFMVLEEFAFNAPEPKRIALGRLVGESGRGVVNTYDLKKRRYISTTSMDSELALITANMALAAAGKLMYDPFTGTGSFPIACAHFGATVMGSDIDGRSIRGKPGRDVVSNYVQYGLVPRYLDGFVSDLTNTPLREGRWLDGIVCDPPYGVREGLKVLGKLGDEHKKEVILNDGTIAHLQEGYVPPKRPYSFEAMLDDILNFGCDMLVDDARLCMWMPTANDEDIELSIPTHPAMPLVSVSVQQFNKWARRLLVYRRLPDHEIDQDALQSRRKKEYAQGSTASELNSFRRKYFQGFEDGNKDDSAALPAA